MSISPRWAVNISAMFTELPYLQRAAAAREAGFSTIESWWPFDSPAPTPAEIDEVVAALQASGCTVVAMNVYGGPAGFRGIASHVGASDDFRQAIDAMKIVSEALGITRFNTAFGEWDQTQDADAQWNTGVRNMAYATEALAEHGQVMIEPLSRLGDAGRENPIRTLEDAARLADDIADASGGIRPGLLLDTFHLTGNGVDPLEQFRAHADQVTHIQFADFPGRDAPGTGAIDFAGFVRGIAADYTGAIALEYMSAGETAPTLEHWRTTIAPLLAD